MSDNTKTLENNHKNEFQLLPKDFRRTDLGWIPKDWHIVRLGNYTLRVGSGITPKGGSKIYIEEGRPFIRSLNVGWGRLQLKNLVFISEKTHSTFNRSQIKKGDVLLNITGASIGRSAVADSRISEGNVNQHVCEIRTKKNKLDSLYLNAFLITKRGQKQIDSFQAGGSRQGLNYSQIKSFLLPLPPIEEQRDIATALSDADNLIESLEKLIAKKQDIKKATMQQLLTGKKRLPGFDGKWEVKRLGDIGKPYGGLSGKTKQDFGTGTARYIPFLNVMENVIIDTDYLDFVFLRKDEKQNKVKKGDLIFNGSSETPEEVGMCAALLDNNSELYLNSFCIGFRLNDLSNNDCSYLAYYFRSEEGRKIMKILAQGATRYNLSKTALNDIEFPLPKLKEQEAIAKVLTDMDNEIETLEQRLKKTKQIKQGMMQNLLTGKIRLNHD